MYLFEFFGLDFFSVEEFLNMLLELLNIISSFKPKDLQHIQLAYTIWTKLRQKKHSCQKYHVEP